MFTLRETNGQLFSSRANSWETQDHYPTPASLTRGLWDVAWAVRRFEDVCQAAPGVARVPSMRYGARGLVPGGPRLRCD